MSVVLVRFEDGAEAEELEFKQLMAVSNHEDHEEYEYEEDEIVEGHPPAAPPRPHAVHPEDQDMMYVSTLHFTDPVDEAGLCTWFYMRHRRDTDTIFAVFSADPDVPHGFHFLTLQGNRIEDPLSQNS